YKDALLQSVQMHLISSSIVVLAIGLGGYLGTTLGVEVACLARSRGKKIICVAYKPFAFETSRHQATFDALEKLQACVDELIVHDHATGLSTANQSQSVRDYFITI